MRHAQMIMCSERINAIQDTHANLVNKTLTENTIRQNCCSLSSIIPKTKEVLKAEQALFYLESFSLTVIAIYAVRKNVGEEQTGYSGRSRQQTSASQQLEDGPLCFTFAY